MNFFDKRQQRPNYKYGFLFIIFLIYSNILFGQFCNNDVSTENITVTQNIQNSATYSSGRRAFIFDGIAGNTYTFSTCNTSTGDTKLRLYDSASGGTELAVSDNDCGANGKQSEIIWICVSSGTYSILLTKKNCKNLNFDAALSYVMTVPDPCSEITLNVNAGGDISLCNGSNINIDATASVSYNEANYNHCEATGNMDFITAITNFSFIGETSFNNSSGKTQAYTDYGNSFIGEVVAGATYPNGLSMAINSAGDWTILGTVWIDWNRNDIFEDSEAYQMGSTTNDANGLTTLSPLTLSVPVNVTPGYVKVRVICKWDGEGNPSVCETDFDGEVEDYALLITAPLTYSWTPTTSLNDPTILNPNCSATESISYTIEVSTNNGCTSTDNNNLNVENPPIITSSSNVTGTETCGEISISVSTDAADGSGSWSHTNGIGLFLSPTDASTTYTTNTFNTPQNLIWTSNTGICSGSEAVINAFFNQPNTSNLTELEASSSWLWGGLTNSEYSEPNNWYKWDGFKWLRETSSIPSDLDKIYVQSNNESGLCVSESSNLTISSNIESLFISNESTTHLSGDINITGDINNNGTLNAISGSLSMNGGNDQFLTGTGTTTLNNFTINKTSGDFIMNTPLTVTNNLSLTSGIIQNSNDVLTIGTSSANEGSISYISGRITGKLRRYFGNGNVDVLFPVGDAVNTKQVMINFQGSPGTNQFLTVAYETGYAQGNEGNLVNGLPLSTPDGAFIDNVSSDGYWEIMPTDDDYASTINSKTYTISLQAVNLTGVTDYSTTRIVKSAGSNTPSENHNLWTATEHIGASGTNTDFTITSQSSGFSFFTIGGSGNNALPVELSSFSGECFENSVELFWQTESEQNSSHFILEHSRTGEDWDIIDSQNAAEFSNETIEYYYFHNNVSSGNNYYRLNQIDTDGTMQTFNILNVNCENNASSYFTIYPNPSNGNIHLVLNDQQIIGEASIRVIDAKGNIVLKKPIEVKNGINMYMLDEEISSGIYYINIMNGATTTKIVKHSIL